MFKLEIETDDDVLGSDSYKDLERILEEVAFTIGFCHMIPGSGVVLDANGNTVGKWELTK